VVSASAAFRDTVSEAVAGSDIQLIEYHSGTTFLDVVDKDYFDAVVFDYVLPDVPAVRLVEELQNKITPYTPPAIVFGPAQIDWGQLASIARLAKNAAVRYVSSSDLLLEETIWLMHRSESALSEKQKAVMKTVRDHDPVLAGKT